MQTFFSSSKFKSFQRSLNLWGFETVSRGPEKGARFHKHFVRGGSDLCRLMTRTKVKGTPKTKHEVSQSEPASDCLPRSVAAYNPASNSELPNCLNGSNAPSRSGTPFAALSQHFDLSTILSQRAAMNSAQALSLGVQNNANSAASLDHMLAVSRSLIAAQHGVDPFQLASAAEILSSRAAIQRCLNAPASSTLPGGPQVLNASAIVNFVANQILAQESSRQLTGKSSGTAPEGRIGGDGGVGQGI